MTAHELLPPDVPRRPNRWLGMDTCQCVCGCGFVAISKPPDFGPALCPYCAEGRSVGEPKPRRKRTAVRW